MPNQGHIAVDLDGTLASFNGWHGPEHIGLPVPVMLERVKQWLKNGIEVKIFTARACIPEYVPYVKQWLKDNGLPDLEVTNKKDFSTLEIWDDIAVGIIPNSGKPKLARDVEACYAATVSAVAFSSSE